MSQCNLGEPWRVQMDADVRAAAARAWQPAGDLQGRAERLAHAARAGRGVRRAGCRPDHHQPEGGGATDRGRWPLLPQRRFRSSCSTARCRATSTPRSSAPTTSPSAVRPGSGCGKRWAAGADRGAQGTDDFDPGAGSEPRIPRGHRSDRQSRARGRVQRRHAVARAQRAERDGVGPRRPDADIDAVYAHNDPGAHGAWLAARGGRPGAGHALRGASTRCRTRGSSTSRRAYSTRRSSTPLAATEAIDIALAILQGEAVPKQIVLGTRIFTQENVEQGGGQAIN